MLLSGKVNQLHLEINYSYANPIQAKDNSVNSIAPITTILAPITNLRVTLSNLCKNKNDIPATNNGLVCIIGKTIVTGPDDIAMKYAIKNPVFPMAATTIHRQRESLMADNFGNLPLHQRYAKKTIAPVVALSANPTNMGVPSSNPILLKTGSRA